MDKIIKIGLLGFGMAGRVFHAPMINCVPGLQLSKIRAGRPESVALAKSTYPDAVVVADDQSILNDPAIDLVVVATTNDTHFALAKVALQAGKHVVVEKPFTVSLAEGKELIELARKHQKILSVYQNRRWDSDFRTVKKLLQGNLLGRVVEYEAHFDRFRPQLTPDTWKEEALPGTGLLYDLGSHLIDQALYLFGLPEEVSADMRIQRTNGQIIDHFEVTLYYKTGLKATLKAGMLVKQPRPRFNVFGDKGSFVKYGLDVQEAALKLGRTPSDSPGWGIESNDLWGKLDTELNGQHFIGKVQSEPGDYRGYYENVRNAILGLEELVVKPEQGLQTIQVIELAMQSSKERKALPFMT